MSQSNQSKIFVTSADHYVGKHLVTLLASVHHQSAFSEITCGGQNRAKMRELERLGNVNVVQYQPNDKKDLVQNFKGHDIVCMLPPVVEQRGGSGGSSGGQGEPNPQELERWSQWLRECGRAMIEACHQANVKCALLITPLVCDQQGGQGGHGHGLLNGFHQIEQWFEQSQIQHKCIIKPGLLMQNFLLFSHHVQQNGVLPSPTEQGRFAPISLRDVSRFIACVASGKKMSGGPGGVLDRPQQEWRENMQLDKWQRDPKSDPISPQHEGKKYKLTGKELVNGEQAVQKLSKAINSPVKYKSISINEARKIVQNSDERPEKMEVELLMETYEQVRNGKYDQQTDEFKKVTGREPVSLEDFFEDHGNDFKQHGGR